MDYTNRWEVGSYIIEVQKHQYICAKQNLKQTLGRTAKVTCSMKLIYSGDHNFSLLIYRILDFSNHAHSLEAVWFSTLLQQLKIQANLNVAQLCRFSILKKQWTIHLVGHFVQNWWMVGRNMAYGLHSKCRWVASWWIDCLAVRFPVIYIEGPIWCHGSDMQWYCLRTFWVQCHFIQCQRDVYFCTLMIMFTWHADGVYCSHLVGPGDLTNMPYIPITRLSSSSIFFIIYSTRLLMLLFLFFL